MKDTLTPKEVMEQKKLQPYAVKGLVTKAAQTVDMTKRTVTGYYNTFNYLDEANDLIMAGAFKNSIAQHGPTATEASYKIKHLLHHNWEKVLTAPHILEEKETTWKGKTISGLYYESNMPNTADGNDTLIKYQEGIYDQHSIGYQYLDGQYVEKGSAEWDRFAKLAINAEIMAKTKYMYVWHELKLFEGSTVGIGCNMLTPYLGVKSREGIAMKMGERLDNLQKQLSLGKISPDASFEVEMQMAQIKQMLSELMVQMPDTRDTFKEGQSLDDTPVKSLFSKFGEQL